MLKDIKESLNEALAADMKPEDYQKEISKKFCSNGMNMKGKLKKGDVYHNPPTEEQTSKRKAYGPITWIEYWRRLTGFNGNHLKCSFCGGDIFINVDECDAFLKRMNKPLNDKSDYQAEGGHYHKNRKDNSDGYIIIPVCKTCNGRNSDYDLVVKEENEYVEELGTFIDK